MAGVWCDVLLVRFSSHESSKQYSVFFPVPFSSGGLTVQRVLSLESELCKSYADDAHVLGYDLLNEMLIDEVHVETVVTRAEMELLIPKGNAQ
ncbi:hypothetical protein G379_gp123 [Dickeya phage vB-DsoM-LIMEstone1]|uniref:DUF7425 domain-containing protein n=11 Tax=Limestonevirus limestone TaxID=1091052 RepID=I0J2X0_9CAUD|nr:hypothetical protein G379_gp123 [Dickeya phage vB-DsoM-LIMEstone1]AIM51460.1 hypothetical protein HQ80_0093 [Dickeya phage phiD3]ASD51280.1 hypothetical protein [Dickeya phage JA15]ATW62098.1 hypothetical protein [Dickeya phage PP35]QHB41602.1 hypothetical protein [Dickeya phage Ds5CZ]QHB41804.1 hypothetical protein [Dickeya phage Ds9CZ]QHB42007.1 hypothetical protein [Dickeya phage Ds16CZ]QHB42210.1 hypothetical protein [Dickeya phage Ds20CZ]QHB42407.1 hypothetical protein [Dickeya phag